VAQSLFWNRSNLSGVVAARHPDRLRQFSPLGYFAELDIARLWQPAEQPSQQSAQ
jgi:hypothetical protein